MIAQKASKSLATMRVLDRGPCGFFGLNGLETIGNVGPVVER